MPSDYGAGEDSWESLGKQGDQTNLKGNQPWILTERTDTEAETPVLRSSNANGWLIGKVPDAGKDWGQKEKRSSEDETAGWHHRCNGHELGQTSGNGGEQRELACCTVYGVTESDMTGRLNKNNNNLCIQVFVWTYVSNSPSRSRIARLCGNSIFNILRNCQIIFQNSWPFCTHISNAWGL